MRVSEDILHFLETDDAGWVAHRHKLSDEVCIKLETFLGNKIKDERKMDRLIQMTCRGFSTAVEIGCVYYHWQSQIDKIVDERDLKKRPPRKVGVILRDYIDNLLLVLERSRSGERHVKLENFINDLERFPSLDRLVTMQLEERMEYDPLDPLRNAPEIAAPHFFEVLSEIRASLSSSITSGPAFPAYSFLAIAFLRYYHAVTGSMPTRTYNSARNREAGPVFNALEILARDLHAQLPEDRREPAPPKMDTPYRKAIARLKAELTE